MYKIFRQKYSGKVIARSNQSRYTGLWPTITCKY